MHDKVRDSLKIILQRALDVTQRVPLQKVPQFIYTKKDHGWTASQGMRTVLPFDVFNCLDNNDIELLHEVLNIHHPEHFGLVGTASIGQIRLDAALILRNLLLRSYISLATRNWRYRSSGSSNKVA